MSEFILKSECLQREIRDGHLKAMRKNEDI